MSETTFGYLFLKRDEEKIWQSPPPEMVLDEGLKKSFMVLRLKQGVQNIPPFVIRPLNEKWSVLIIEEISTDESSKARLEKWVLETSQNCPILHFYNADVYGWGYEIFVGGRNVASVNVDYEGLYVARRIDEKNQESHAELFASRAEQYKNKNLGEFSAFDIEPTILDRLDRILTADRYLGRDIWEQVEEFKKHLEISEMTFIDYYTEIRENYLEYRFDE